MCTITDATASDNATKIEITFPPNAAVVNITAGVQGTGNVPAGKKLWIVVSDGYNYFPQTNVTFNEKNTSEWHAQVNLGGEDNGGLYYRIDAVLASNETANSTLANNSHNPIGLSFLPEGAESVDYVVVERVKIFSFWEQHADALIGVGGTLAAGILGILYEKSRKCEKRRKED